MTFLALTPLQAALLAALTAAAIVALYFLKLRYRRVFVSSSMLWGRVLDEQGSRSLWERLRTIVSIVLAVTIALSIALSVARPEIESLTGRAGRMVVVLDTSPSMNARTADGRTRWRHAVERAQALIEAAGPTVEFRIAETSGETVFPFTADRAEAARLVDRLSPEGATPRFPAVDGRDSTVYFVSDGVGLRDVPPFAERVSVFEAANNVAVTAFEIRPVPSNPLEYEAYLELQNDGRPSDVELTLSGAGQDSIRKTVRLASDEQLKEVFDLSSFGGGAVQASIRATGDALAADDVAFAYLPVRRKTQTLLVTRGNKYLETLLKLDRHVDLFTTHPRNYRERPEIDAYVFDRFAPTMAPSKPALVIGAPAAPWLRSPQGVVHEPVITTWSEDHPIMQYVGVHDISIARAARINPEHLLVIAASSDTPLIVASEKPRWVMLTFDLGSSDFALQSGFPVFVRNVLAWLNGEELALRRAPGTIEVPLANADVRAADGKVVPSEQQLGKTIFRLKEPGLYTASQGETRLHVAVNLANPDLSAVNRSVFKAGASGASTVLSSPWLRHELWFYMLLGALVLISAEWLSYHRRITL